MDMIERCILETRVGEKLLYSRYTHAHGYSAQVHDGKNLLAEMLPYYAKRGQNFCVNFYEPWDNATASRRKIKTTFHGTRESAFRKMERLAIAQFKERYNA